MKLADKALAGLSAEICLIWIPKVTTIFRKNSYDDRVILLNLLV